MSPAAATLEEGMGAADTSSKAKEVRTSAQKLLALDHFAALGVARTAGPDEVKKAFIEAVKAWHPDRVPPGLEELRPLFGKIFARLELARATVSDPQRRAKYIEDLARPTGGAATAGEMASAEATLEFRKAEAMLKKHDAVQAEAHLRRAVQLAPGVAEYQVLLVWLQAKPDSTIGRLRELATDLDRLLDRDPQSERAYFYRAQLKKRLDLTKEAMADFARAAELNPNNVDAVREVRLYKMRQEKAAPAAAATVSGGEGVGGFFRKLFKR
jgi:curved DNA-binding protein CbpA